MSEHQLFLETFNLEINSFDMYPILQMHILSVISLGTSRPALWLLVGKVIANAWFEEGNASICLCYNTIYVRVPV